MTRDRKYREYRLLPHTGSIWSFGNWRTLREDRSMTATLPLLLPDVPGHDHGSTPCPEWGRP